MTEAQSVRVPCTPETRRLIKQAKRHGENYDSVLRKMVKQYDPEKASQRVQEKV